MTTNSAQFTVALRQAVRRLGDALRNKQFAAADIECSAIMTNAARIHGCIATEQKRQRESK